MKKSCLTLSCALVATIMIGCGSNNSSTTTVTKIDTKAKLLSTNFTPVTHPSSTQKNPHVIDASTMIKWLDDWKKNRPNSVKGKLIVLQVGGAFYADSTHTFIKHDDVNIFTFDKAGGCSNTDPMFDRTDGVQVIPKAVLSGQMMDGAFKMYNIDPINDMLLIVAGGDKKVKGMRENAAAMARFAWSMHYWGMSHYAVLDGNIQYMLNPKTNPSIKNQGITSLDDIFVPDASIPPMSGTHSVKEISSLHQEVMASLEEMIKTVKYCPNKSFILDARSKDEYDANNQVKMSKTEAKVCGPNHDAQCFTAIEGHIKGAKHIEYSNFIVTDDETKDTNEDGKVDALDASYRFKTPKEMLKLLSNAGYDAHSQTLYTYCRTGTRAALPAFIGMDILHIPTKLFDGSWIEWGRLAGKTDTKDVHGNILLRCDSPWRTDRANLTEKLTYNPASLVAPRVREGSPLTADEYACHANKIKNDDAAYIQH